MFKFTISHEEKEFLPALPSQARFQDGVDFFSYLKYN